MRENKTNNKKTKGIDPARNLCNRKVGTTIKTRGEQLFHL